MILYSHTSMVEHYQAPLYLQLGIGALASRDCVQSHE